MKTQQQGQRGEALARRFLENAGYLFIESNFRRRVGEIDLIMSAPLEQLHTQSVVVFVEVRYRATAGFGGALASIDFRKQRKMLRAANAWLQKNASSTQIARIDVIAMEPLPAGPSLTSPSCNPARHEHIWGGHRLQWIPSAVEEPT